MSKEFKCSCLSFVLSLIILSHYEFSGWTARESQEHANESINVD
jgi:hypothetical protein